MIEPAFEPILWQAFPAGVQRRARRANRKRTVEIGLVTLFRFDCPLVLCNSNPIYLVFFSAGAIIISRQRFYYTISRGKKIEALGHSNLIRNTEVLVLMM